MFAFCSASVFALRLFVPSQVDELPFQEHPPKPSSEPYVREIATSYGSATVSSLLDQLPLTLLRLGPTSSLPVKSTPTSLGGRASMRLREVGANHIDSARVLVHSPLSRGERSFGYAIRLRAFPRGR